MVVTRSLSVVMPVYNEAPVLPQVLDEVRRLVLDVVPGSELVVIDDCSTDATMEVLAEAAADSRIRVLHNSTNVGHGRSVRRGFDDASGAWILQIDSDGQVDLARFADFWTACDAVDLVVGVRVDRCDGMHRRVISRCAGAVASLLARRRLRDANVPFKLIRADLYRHLAPFIRPDSFAPSIMLVVGAARVGARISEVEVRHLPRLHGASTIRLWRLARAIARSLVQTLLFGVRRLPRYPTDG